MVTIGISVICYNKEKYIIKALNSIYNQKISDDICVKCVIVNDASTDNSKDVINNYIKKHNKKNISFELINSKENNGAGKTKKNAINYLKYKYDCDYYMFLDGDDYYINDNFIYNAYTIISTLNADIVEYGFRYNNGEEVIMKIPKVDGTDIIEGGNLGLSKLFQGNYISFMMWSKIISKKIINEVELSDKRKYEDIINVTNWVYNAKKIVLVPLVEINYRYDKNSLTKEDIFNSKYETLKTLYEMFEKYGNNEEIVRSIYNRAYIDFHNILYNFTSDEIKCYEEIYTMYVKIFKKLQEFNLY